MVGKINKRGRLPDGAPNPIDVHVGRKIFERRAALGLSMERVAASIGLTFQQVQKYERGLNRVSASRLFDFSKVLGVAVNYFFSDIDGEIEKNSPRKVRAGTKVVSHDEIDDPLQREESRILAKSYYSIKDRALARNLYDLMLAISHPNDKEVDEE